jgi:hypothetical protein
MPGPYLRRYGSTDPVYFPIWAADGTALQVGTFDFDAGDLQIEKDGGGANNVTGTATIEARGMVSYTPVAADMQCKCAKLTLIDADTVTLDEPVVIETYGHPSAMHPAMGIPVVDTGIIVSATSTTARLATTAPVNDDIINSSLIYISAGTGAGQTRNILDYDQATDTVTVQAWAVTPDTTSVYQILPAPPSETGANAPEATISGLTVADLEQIVADLQNGGRLDLIFDAITSGVNALLVRIPSALFIGITSLAEWIGALAGKQTPDATAQTEIRASGAGSGTYDATTDSQEAIGDNQAAVKAKTDSLTFTVAGQVDANAQSLNDTPITGDGVSPKFGV